MVQLGDVCEHNLGKMLDKQKNKGTPRPYLRNPNVLWFDFDLSDLHQMPFQDHELSKYQIEPGDVIICEGGEAGRAAIWDGRRSGVLIQKALHRVRTSPDLYNRFLVYQLLADAKSGRLREYFTGTTIPHFTGQDLHRYTFALPPLSEQKRIAAILDKTDALRRKRQQALQLTEQFLRSTFLDMFGDPVANPKGWPTATLEQLIKVKSGEFLPAKEMEETGGFAVYGGNGINGRHASYMFEEPVIVIGRVGVYCGVIHVTEPKSWVTDNALYVAQADDRLTLSYLEWALRLANLNQYASQAAQPLISAGRIYGVAICVPDVRSQRRFTEVVVQHGAFVNRVRNACRKGDDLFNSLVQRAFRGEL